MHKMTSLSLKMVEVIILSENSCHFVSSQFVTTFIFFSAWSGYMGELPKFNTENEDLYGLWSEILKNFKHNSWNFSRFTCHKRSFRTFALHGRYSEIISKVALIPICICLFHETFLPFPCFVDLIKSIQNKIFAKMWPVEKNCYFVYFVKKWDGMEYWRLLL